MIKRTMHAAGWMMVGMVVMGLIVWFATPSLMLVTHKSKLSYDETVSVLSKTLKKKKGWRVLTVNDHQKSTAAYAALDRVGSVTIYNPRYASKILADDADRSVTAFMPLGLGVYEDRKGQVFVSQPNVGLFGMMFGGAVADAMRLANRDLNQAVQSVSAM